MVVIPEDLILALSQIFTSKRQEGASLAGHSHGVLWDEVHQGAQCVLPQLLKAEFQESSLRAA